MALPRREKTPNTRWDSPRRRGISAESASPRHQGAHVDVTSERSDATLVERRSPDSTTAHRIKALFLAVSDARGAPEALAFLERAGIQEDLIADETRPIPTELWYRALSELERTLGAEALGATAPFHIHSSNIGVWTGVLRGAQTPSDAYARLDQLGLDQGGEEPSLSDWKTLAVRESCWWGNAPLPRLVEDTERCTQARLAELRAVALLFGCTARRIRFTHAPEESVTRFEVHWSRPWRWMRAGATAVGAMTGAGAALLLEPNAAAPATWGAAGALVGLACGAAGFHDAQRHAQAKSQSFRIFALERSAALKNRRDAGGVFEPGTVLGGQFRLRNPIGVGATGAVWEAERLGDSQLVALKLLRTALAHHSQAADRLRREADALGLAWHPNVVEIFEHGHLPGGVAYIAMERLVGESLAQRLEREPRLEHHEVQDIALQACDALDAIHAAGVVHRDIKPANLFLTTDDSGNTRLKLVDFGVAQVAWAETRLTRSGTAIGTPGYMAPEQEAGRVVDGRSDLFSLGGVLYQALVGRPPPIPPPWYEVGPLVPWIDFEGIDPAWRPIVEQLLAPAPNQRFPDARTLRVALRALDPACERSSA